MRPRADAERLLPVREVDAPRSNDEPRLLASATTRTSKPLREQIVPLLVQLPQERAADVADADHGQRQPLALLEERLVNHVERPHLLRRVDDA